MKMVENYMKILDKIEAAMDGKNAMLKWRVKQWLVKDNHAELNKTMPMAEFRRMVKKRPNARFEIVSLKPLSMCDHSWDMHGYFVYYQFGYYDEDKDETIWF